jgi:type II secretory ATPase GspE/PulE/Tfp pilus assembly ATPase PilB-like protein
MHLEPFLLGATMNIAIAQRLGRRICERCKAPHKIPPEIEEQIVPEIKEIPAEYFEEVGLPKDGPYVFYKGRGCLRCKDSGYVGRVAVAEVLEFNEELRDLVTTGFPPDKVREIIAEQRMINVRQDALLKALEGFTTIEEVMRITAE